MFDREYEHLPDHIERGERKCEDWYFDNVVGDTATCSCGKKFKFSEGQTLSADPYAIPVCPDCFDEWFLSPDS